MTNPSSLHPTILAAEDDSFQAELLRLFFEKNNLNGHIVQNGKAALEYLEAHNTNIQAILLDINMPVLNGPETFKRLRAQYPKIPVLFLTGSTDVHVAITAMREGAFDYIIKPFDPTRLALTIRNAETMARLQRAAQPRKWRTLSDITLDDLVGHKDTLADLITTARKIANSSVPVLIGGETGTGKEVLAHAIHNDSPRKNAPFIALNCGAIPENLIESILFGHEKGAFTGATEKTPGKFREAEGGTIFLDEIGDMPLSAQIRLLRVLQQHEIQPVGDSRPVTIDVRIIAATHKNLELAVTSGTFREDLFYRLNVIPLTLPPLRQRHDDILDLARHFIERFCIEENLPPRIIAQDAEKKLISYTWPGNIRELENTMRRAIILSSSESIYAHDLQIGEKNLSVNLPEISETLQHIPNTQDSKTSTESLSQDTLKLTSESGKLIPLSALEHIIVAHAFQKCDGNIQATARALGVARTTIYRKLVKE